MSRANRLENWISPRLLLICGLVVIPAYLFQRSIPLKAAQLAVFLLVSLLGGRRLRLLGNLLFFAAVVVANLLTPSGRVLVSTKSFAITETALNTGLLKALTFVGLFYISAFSIHPGIRLPGKLGHLLSRTFGYFHLLLQEKRFRPTRPVESLDAVLLRLNEQPFEEPTKHSIHTTAGGFSLVAGVVAVSWGCVVLGWVGIVG